jgi:predicted amidohydrolase YtcJ
LLFTAILAVGLAATSVAHAQTPQPAASQAGGAVTVFTAKKIVTMDPGWPEATAVAVQNGRILSVGTLEDLQPWLQRFPYTIDRRFEQNVIYPGFVEPHSHPLVGGTSLTRPLLTYFPTPNPYGPAFPGVKDKAAAFAKLGEYVAAHKGDDVLVSWGYDVVAMGGYIDKADLDKVSATVPILVWDASEHFVFGNSAAIKKLGLTPALAKQVPGVGLSPDGQLNGQFLGERAAQAVLVKPFAALLDPPIARKNMKFLSDLAQQAGVTIMSDLALGLVDVPLETQLMGGAFNDPATNQRAVVVVNGESFEAAYGAANMVAEAQKLRATDTDTLMFNGVKFFSDDGLLSLGMEMTNPGYIESDKYHGLFMFDSMKDFVADMSPWWNAGFHIHVHTNGNAGNQATIDALAALQAEKPRFDHRFTLEHYGISTPEQARQVKALGGIVSINPYYLYARGDLNGPQIGVDRANTAARLKTLTDEGVVVSLHTDTPVAPPRPLEEVWIAVNRIGEISGKVLGPAERVPVSRAMRMVTIDAAYTLGVEKKVGSIAAGKFADLVVLGEDPQTVDPMTIRDIPVIATVLGGRIIPTASTRTAPQ